MTDGDHPRMRKNETKLQALERLMSKKETTNAKGINLYQAWKVESEDCEIRAYYVSSGQINQVRLQPSEAREMAMELIRAADDVELSKEPDCRCQTCKTETPLQLPEGTRAYHADTCIKAWIMKDGRWIANHEAISATPDLIMNELKKIWTLKI